MAWGCVGIQSTSSGTELAAAPSTPSLHAAGSAAWINDGAETGASLQGGDPAFKQRGRERGRWMR